MSRVNSTDSGWDFTLRSVSGSGVGVMPPQVGRSTSAGYNSYGNEVIVYPSSSSSGGGGNYPHGMGMNGNRTVSKSRYDGPQDKYHMT